MSYRPGIVRVDNLASRKQIGCSAVLLLGSFESALLVLSIADVHVDKFAFVIVVVVELLLMLLNLTVLVVVVVSLVVVGCLVQVVWLLC